MPSGVYQRTPENTKNLNKSKIGKPSWNKGKKLHYEVWNKGKPFEIMKDNQFAKGNKPNKTSFKKGERSSIKTEFKKGEMSLVQKGEKNSNWKGGLSNKEKLELKAGRKKPLNCEVCGGGGVICFDHDHKTGKFRGWICSRCNLTLGQVKDNSELLLALSDYLKNNVC